MTTTGTPAPSIHYQIDIDTLCIAMVEMYPYTEQWLIDLIIDEQITTSGQLMPLLESRGWTEYKPFMSDITIEGDRYLVDVWFVKE